jgi:hypothetical protein
LKLLIENQVPILPVVSQFNEVTRPKIDESFSRFQAIVFDDVGVSAEYIKHLKWLVKQLEDVRCFPWHRVDWEDRHEW